MIRIAILVNKAVEEVNTIPILGFSKDIVEVPIADQDPTKISVIINNTLFLLKIEGFILLFIRFIITFRRFKCILMVVFFCLIF